MVHYSIHNSRSSILEPSVVGNRIAVLGSARLVDLYALASFPKAFLQATQHSGKKTLREYPGLLLGLQM